MRYGPTSVTLNSMEQTVVSDSTQGNCWRHGNYLRHSIYVMSRQCCHAGTKLMFFLGLGLTDVVERGGKLKIKTAGWPRVQNEL